MGRLWSKEEPEDKTAVDSCAPSTPHGPTVTCPHHDDGDSSVMTCSTTGSSRLWHGGACVLLPVMPRTTSRTTVSHSAAWWCHAVAWWPFWLWLLISCYWTDWFQSVEFHFGQLSPSSPQNRWHGLPVNIRNLLDKRFSKKAEPILCLICRDIQAKMKRVWNQTPEHAAAHLHTLQVYPQLIFMLLAYFYVQLMFTALNADVVKH